MTHQWAVSPPHNTPQEPAFLHSSPYKAEGSKLTPKVSASLFSSRLRDQSKLACAVASRCHESWICYWIKTPTLGGKLQGWSWMPAAWHFPWTQNPQPWETERPFPNNSDRNLEVKALLQCKNSGDKIHAIMSPTSFPSKCNTTYYCLIPCSCNSPHPPSSCMKISTTMMPCGHLKATQLRVLYPSVAQVSWGRAYSKWKTVPRLPRHWENIPIKERLHQKSPFIHVFLRTASLWQQHLTLINTETSLVSLKMHVYWCSC